MLFDRWRQRVLPWGTLAPPGEYDWTCASFGPLESTTQTANGSVKQFLHSLRQKVPIHYNGRPYPPELPLLVGDLDLPCNTWCFGPMWAHNPSGTSNGSTVFAQTTAKCLYFTMVCLFPLKIAPSMLASGPHVIRGSLGPPTRVRNANGNLIVSAVFAGLISVTGWQTDRQTDRPRYSVLYGSPWAIKLANLVLSVTLSNINWF